MGLLAMLRRIFRKKQQFTWNPLISCGTCSYTIPKEAVYCSHCGDKQEETQCLYTVKLSSGVHTFRSDDTHPFHTYVSKQTNKHANVCPDPITPIPHSLRRHVG
jgi:hypothetical protein